ncbi:MAG: hypothetical protein JXA24_03555 [Proteobacteria bacterium]|nr:hypothetical protein [Pseudomonadota bacterium]
MAEKGRWEKGMQHTKREIITSSSEVRTEWKNPLSGDPTRLVHASVGVKGFGLKVGMRLRF